MSTFITSDLHFNHTNILVYADRPFTDVAHMNEMLIKNYNDVVDVGDFVIFVGDVCMGRREESLPLVKRLNGFKVLINGNHDDCHPMYSHKKNYKDKCAMYAEYFDDIIYDNVYVYEEFLVCHFPYDISGNDHNGRDFADYEPIDIGMPLLHGHVHSHTPISVSKNGSWMYDVGCDANGYTPISIDSIRDIYKNHYR